MEKLFINFKLAKLLKEKGFDEPCLGYYSNVELSKLRITQTTNFNGTNYTGIESCWLAPIYQQVFNWINEKYKIQMFPDYEYYDGFHYGYKWVRSDGKYGIIWKDNNGDNPDGSNTIEEATILAIEEILKTN
jgi:hypothetical protein